MNEKKDTNIIKVCRRCRQQYTAAYFNVNRRATDGLTTYCVYCLREMRRKRTRKDKETRGE